jgi:phosphoserine phosphatase
MSDEQLELNVEEMEPLQVIEEMPMPLHPPLDPRLTQLRRWMDDNGFAPIILTGAPVELVMSEILKRLFIAEIAINALMKVDGDDE